MCCAWSCEPRKLVKLSSGGLAPAPAGELPFKVIVGAENIVSWSPHPNPPPLVFPPLCVSPWIGGLEPTAVQSTLTPPEGPGLTNLLVPSRFPSIDDLIFNTAGGGIGASLGFWLMRRLEAWLPEQQAASGGRTLPGDATPRLLGAIPVFGYPGWMAQGDTAAFYDDARYFRPLRA